METDTEFLLRRAKEESLKALETNQPIAADLHQQLAVRYSTQAAMALANEDEEREGSTPISTGCQPSVG